MKKRGKIRKPSQLRIEAGVVAGSKLKIKKQIEAQTRYRLYRGDLSKLAQRRYLFIFYIVYQSAFSQLIIIINNDINRINKIQQIRSNYNKFLKKEAKFAAEADDEEDDDGDGNMQSQEDLVEVD